MKAWKQLFPRRSNGRFPIHSSALHSSPDKSTISGIMSKLQNTVLCMEASRGPATRACLGLAQAGAAGGLIYGTGYAVAYLTTGIRENEPISLSRAEKYALFADLSTAVPDIQVSEDTIKTYAEEKESRTAKRKNTTYFHTYSGMIMAGFSSLLSFQIFQNKSVLIQIASRPLASVGLGIVTPLLLGSLVRSIPITENPDGKLIPFGKKEVAHLLYAGTIGLIAAPLYILGGVSMTRAVYVTTGVIGGLHCLAPSLPKNSLAPLETPLIYAMNAVLVSFLATLLLRQTHGLFPALYKFMMHGGLGVYTLNYATTLQKIDASAKSPHYDAVNAAMALSMNIFNIYARLAFLLPPHFQVARDSVFVEGKHGTYNSSIVNTKALAKHKNPEDGGGGGGGRTH